MKNKVISRLLTAAETDAKTHQNPAWSNSEQGLISKNTRVRRYLFLSTLAVTTILMLLFFVCVTGSEDKTEQKAEAVAAKVKKKSKQTEKAEGKNDLVKDKVSVKTDTWGECYVEQIGEASWYGNYFHGKKTASGETFNQYGLTAAHPTLPMGTEATVTNLDTGESVDVIINDRGPYHHGRDIDLSKKAAEEIGMKKDGAAPVKIEAKVSPEDDKKEDDKPKKDKKDTD